MNQILTQIQEEFDKKFLTDFDMEIVGWNTDEPDIDEIKDFLTQSNLRVIEKVKEWVEHRKPIRRSEQVTHSTYNDGARDILDEFENFLSLIEQK